MVAGKHFEGDSEVIRTHTNSAYSELKQLPKGKYVHIDHVYKGSPGNRVLSDMYIIEFSSNEDRENILKDLVKNSQKYSSGAILNIDRAKTKLQLQRNACLCEAADILKKDKKYAGKKIEIIWKNAESGNKNREVKVGDQIAFSQEISDLKRSFSASFDHSL